MRDLDIDGLAALAERAGADDSIWGSPDMSEAQAAFISVLDPITALALIERVRTAEDRLARKRRATDLLALRYIHLRDAHAATVKEHASCSASSSAADGGLEEAARE